MKRLEVRCRACEQQVQVDPETVILHHNPDRTHGTYAYGCPNCGERVRRHATGSGINLLLSAGVEGHKHAGGPPLDNDDLLDLMLDLRSL